MKNDCQQMSQVIKGSKEKKRVGQAFPGQNSGPDQSLRRHSHRTQMGLAQNHQQEGIAVRHRADKTISADTTKHGSWHPAGAPETGTTCRVTRHTTPGPGEPGPTESLPGRWGPSWSSSSLFQKVKGQDLQDIQLMGHLGFDGAVPRVSHAGKSKGRGLKWFLLEGCIHAGAQDRPLGRDGFLPTQRLHASTRGGRHERA